MPHKSESGKIITSKTPLLSSHSTKISTSSSTSSPCSLSSNNTFDRVSSTKMKNKNNSVSGATTTTPTATMLKNGQHQQLKGMDLSKSPVESSFGACAPSETEITSAANGIGHSNFINGNSLTICQRQSHGEAPSSTGDNHQGSNHHPHTLSLSSSSAPAVNGKKAENEAYSYSDEEDEEHELVNGHSQRADGESPSLKNGFLHFHPPIKDQCDVPCRKDFIKTLDDAEEGISRPKKIYRVVLTGGPCGGKTTGQARLCTFFENMGWKVYRVPEAATVLLGGGIKFGELNEANAIRFQEELLRTMMQIESVFFRMAETVDQDVLIICDRGTMDASAFIKRSYWEDILARNNLNEVDIRDTRYNQIIHMVSAANGAEPFYTTEDHVCRSEGINLARELDKKAAQAWVGHPYFDVVDNSSDFEAKVCRMIQCVCQKLGIDAKDRLETNAKKVKFLVKGPLPESDAFPNGFQDFTVVHDYLQTNGPKVQARLRKRGQKNHFSYTYTVRRPELQGQVVEVKTTLTQRDYNNMLAQRDHNHVTVYKNRRCFLLNDQYFQLDVYKDPCHPRCKGLILLETYSTLHGTELYQRLPKFLNITREVTGDPRYSMFNLSLKDKWVDNKYFCQSLSGAESIAVNGEEYTKSELQLADC